VFEPEKICRQIGFRPNSAVQDHSSLALLCHLRKVPTIVSAHTFCASRKTLFQRALGLTLTQSTTLLMKTKFSYCDQIKFNEPVLKLGTPE